MMSELDSQTRQKYIWNFLGEIAKNNLAVSKEALHKAFGSNDDDLNTIADLCTQNKLPDLTGFISDTGKTVPSVQDIDKTIAGLPAYNLNQGDEADYYLCITIYYSHHYSIELPQFTSVIKFWASMKLQDIPATISQKFIKICKGIAASGLKENSTSNELVAPFKALEKFTSEHSYLIIHQSDYLDIIKSAQDQLDYYNDQQTEIEKEKERGLKLVENAMDEIKTSIATNDEKAQGLVDEAKEKYSENLIEGYVLEFRKDADAYGRNGIRWLSLLIMSFGVTLGLGFVFMSGLKLTPVGTSSIPFFPYVGGLLLITVFLYLLKISLNRFEDTIKDTWKILTPNETQSLRQTIETITWMSLWIFLITLAGSYFSLTINTSEISSTSFLLENGDSVNWAALLTGAAPRLIILILAGSVTYFCMKNYRTQKHLQAVNRYRSTALASFRVFSDTIDASETSKVRRDQLFDQLASLIYSPIDTGYHQDDKLKLAELTNLMASVNKNVGK